VADRLFSFSHQDPLAVAAAEKLARTWFCTFFNFFLGVVVVAVLFAFETGKAALNLILGKSTAAADCARVA
jgi:hypothetical protein